MKKLLLTGASGFLGWHVLSQVQSEWEIIGVYHQRPVKFLDRQMLQLDLTEVEAVKHFFDLYQPDAVLHLAAITNANYCENNKEASNKINFEATVNLVKLCKKKSIPFVFSSTDLVFDGLNAPYLETAKSSAICLYGVQKAAAEKAVLEIYPNVTIARLPLIYGIAPSTNCFFSVWLEKLKNGNSITAFTDEYRTPAAATDVVNGLFLILNKRLTGIWHLGGKERISRYDFAILMAKYFQIDIKLVKAALQKEVTMAAKRPPDVSLNSEKAFAKAYNPKSILENFSLMKVYC